MKNSLKFPGALYMVILQILVSEGSNSIADASISGPFQNSLMSETVGPYIQIYMLHLSLRIA
jgi:hypothetical protein